MRNLARAAGHLEDRVRTCGDCYYLRIEKRLAFATCRSTLRLLSRLQNMLRLLSHETVAVVTSCLHDMSAPQLLSEHVARS